MTQFYNVKGLLVSAEVGYSGHCNPIFDYDKLGDLHFVSFYDVSVMIRHGNLSIDAPARSKHALDVGGPHFLGSLKAEWQLVLCLH